jgi:Phospholipase_D-nuclease N-terminal/Short C-terminal domain
LRNAAEPAAGRCGAGEHGEIAMLFQGGFSFANFLADVVTVFVFVLWFWLIVTVLGDLVRRGDISGIGKALWVIVLIVLPYLGVFAYLLVQGKGMAERSSQRIKEARDDVQRAVGFSVADEIEKLNRLKTSGAISSEEFARLRARLM